MRTLTAPGVEWKEIDRSDYSPSLIAGTACYIPTFTDKGEPYKCKEFTSRSAWLNYFGEPTNEAERYGYAAACEVLNQGGTLYTARLPYYNNSFEQMVGVEFEIIPDQNLPEKYNHISALDSKIDNVGLINCQGIPTTYSFDQIEEYRDNEKKVKHNHFLIVDTTGATYQKIEEDTRKNKNRELIGIIPVVTTAANALYAQSLFKLEYNQISDYEPIDDQFVYCLNNEINGLSAIDLNKKFNTQGYYDKQTCSFTPHTLKFSSGETTLGNNLKNWTSIIQSYLTKHTEIGTFDVTTLSGMKSFYEKLCQLTSKTATLTDSSEVSIVKTALENVMNEYSKEGTTWKDTVTGNTITIEEIKQYQENYNKNSHRIRFTTEKYIIGEAKYSFDGTEGSMIMYVPETLDIPEWHGVDGDDSIPETMSLDAAQYFPVIQPSNNGTGLLVDHLKDIGVIVYKTYLDASEGNKVTYEAVEAFCGSLYNKDVDPNTGVSKFIDTIINSQSQYINFFSNCFNSNQSKNWYLNTCDMLIAPPSKHAVLGFYSDMTTKDISLSKSILQGLNKAFDDVTDINKCDIDIICDAGIANIGSFLKALFDDVGQYDLDITDSEGSSMLWLWKCKSANDPSVKIWKTIEQKYDTFCKSTRKDCMFIADGLRPLVLHGNSKIIRDSKPTNTIDEHILPYFPAICGLNTSYGAGYVDWFQVADDYTGDLFWCPPSIKAMGVYINTDINYNYWDAPAGLNRGIVTATDVAFSPTPKQAGNFYEKNWNYAINYPDDGIVLEGQKTFQVKPSAFDRVNVRRLFLRLERQCYKVGRYFVYEGNTAYLRQRLVDAIDPYFKSAKSGGGIYDYKIQCDENNNTSDTIDNNELHISIGIKPTKTAEFIIFTFIAGSTGASWEEIMG